MTAVSDAILAVGIAAFLCVVEFAIGIPAGVVVWLGIPQGFCVGIIVGNL